MNPLRVWSREAKRPDVGASGSTADDAFEVSSEAPGDGSTDLRPVVGYCEFWEDFATLARRRFE